jgi:hypothetical protein
MWHLKKGKDGQIFGPVDIETLKRWAANGQISPMDSVIDSDSRREYAPYEVPDLEMIWEVTLDDGAVYGPTHANAIRVFVREGQILPKDTVRDILRGEKFLAGEFEMYLEKQYPLAKAEPHPETQIPAVTDKKSETKLRPLEETDRRDYSKTRLKPLDPNKSGKMKPEELLRRIAELEQALKTEQNSYEKLKQHYQDLNQKYVALKDRVASAGPGQE